MIDSHPPLPYYAVIFTSVRADDDTAYALTNDELIAQAELIDGYIGEESARNEFGVSVSYWKDEASIARWKTNVSHLLAQEKGRVQWYERYRLRVCRVDRDYEWKKGEGYVD